MPKFEKKFKSEVITTFF